MGYKDNTFRIRINEKNPSKPRYEVKDVLQIDEKYKQDPKITKLNDHIAVQYQNSTQIRVYYSPLRIEVYKNGLLLVSGNEKGLLNFEHFRNKEDYSMPFEVPQDNDKEEFAKQYWENSWEEHFSSHKDSKKNGPNSVAMDFSFNDCNNVFGIPEHADSFSLKATKGNGITSDPYRLYNLDVFEYELNNPMALYGSVPFMVALHPSSNRVSGILWLNAAETFIDIAKDRDTVQSHWISESGVIDTFIMLADAPHDLMRQYTAVTGRAPIPPLFSIAYHQCRWNYKDEKDVATVDSGFDEHDIPYDVIWLDIEHTDQKKYFTWDSINFPTPQNMQQKIASKHRKMVTIIDPHIKRDGGYMVHKEASSKGYYVKNQESQEYEGWCWPGSSSWLDFTNPAIRDWWSSLFQYDSYSGSSENLFTWNDMNEPSVFNGPEVTMHKDAIHVNDVEHRDLHNLYGYYMHMATYNGLVSRNANSNIRGFVLSRAFYAGSQRFGAIWTGDNAAQWSHLSIAQPMLLSLSIAGISFSGADVGGFFGNPDGELMTRWYQAGAFHPFFRGHAHLDTKRREPWLFGEPYTTHIRNAIRTRYQLLPYIYTLFYVNSVTGTPIMRPLWYHHIQDGSTHTIEDQFLLGDALLVKPVVTAHQTSTTVYLPKNEIYYRYMGSSKAYKGGEAITIDVTLEESPVFQRGGSIIPIKYRTRRSSHLMEKDPYTLIIALNSMGRAYGQLYVDDGISFDYQRNGAFLLANITFENNSLKWNVLNNSYKPTNQIERIVIYGFPSNPSSVTLNSIANSEITFEYIPNVLILRKPNLTILDNFHVLIR